jgi:hypothetical protein
VSDVDTPFPADSLRRYSVEKMNDTAFVDVQRDGVFCQTCPTDYGRQRTRCRHAQAIQRRIARGLIAGPAKENAT